MHWHKTAEWAYILSVSFIRGLDIINLLTLLQGYTQITSVNPDGQNFLTTLVSVSI